MKKQLLIVGIIALLVIVGLSGCNLPTSDTKRTLPDGTVVTGDANQIQITKYNLTKYQNLNVRRWYIDKSPGNDLGFSEVEVTYGSINISDFNTNLSKREYICENYLKSILHVYTWDADYFGYNTYPGRAYHTAISDVSLGTEISSWKVNGTAKNIGKEFLSYPKITVNFYNTAGAWLASAESTEQNKPSGYTWNFSMTYNGEFRNDVNYISFEVTAKPYG